MRSNWFPVKSARPRLCSTSGSNRRRQAATVRPQAFDGAVEAAVGDSRPTAGKRMSVGDLGHREFDPALEAEPLEELRGQRHRVHRRADVVQESGEGQLLGAGSAADGVRPLEHEHGQSGPGQGDGGGQPVRAGSDHNGVRRVHCPPPIRMLPTLGHGGDGGKCGGQTLGRLANSAKIARGSSTRCSETMSRRKQQVEEPVAEHAGLALPHRHGQSVVAAVHRTRRGGP